MSVPHAHVIGDPIAQSKSPLIHGFWLEKLGIAGRYKARHVEAGNLGEYLARYRDDGSWIGCNVTMPHKQTIIGHLDQIDPVARTLGAVNTVVRQENGALIGFNTDADGFLEPLLPILKSQHLFRMARIIGTGGAARAIIAALAHNGFTLVVAGRNPEKAQALIDELAPGGEHHAIPIAYFAEATNFAFDDREGCLDLVINASPLGMRGSPELPFDWSHAPPGSMAYDIVTDPVETPFLNAAREAGHPTINGLSMLVGQAAIAFEKFFGAAPPREHDNELHEILTR
ncbi:shikimate dehydrogenase [Erythrobacter rubeus]|uniref:Shikimate dehydrogenase (NADP(+)) n=1 Tax=Erythrobacter rubeus TaxID=2760803 RepID=A0ABR8KR26_9SPHN|nr:shikimate dehydrogenase [Erythrobacter rubeus]MBD2843204.1 shikimate dehydrogenase [Erythrobacter rubeus]